ncbi:unnamed protein product [Gongylonema pulchrum]|uniref:Peroxisomal biogenesis factor 3 n=1 Tax=Gongylonema pulchrum TaxID=637853 RepID=A0A183ELS5_9BILA|nr:unnamed protein product [Gongylonema pulchrum]
MSGLWEFLKRHRGKIIGGLVVAGGAYVVQQTLSNSGQLFSMDWNREQNLDRIQLQARREYIYDTQHRSCDTIILELLPDLAKRISQHFDVETLIEAIKNNKELDKEQRLALWENVKVLYLCYFYFG